MPNDVQVRPLDQSQESFGAPNEAAAIEKSQQVTQMLARYINRIRGRDAVNARRRATHAEQLNYFAIRKMMEQPAQENLRRPDTPQVVFLEQTALILDVRPRGVLPGQIDRDPIGIEPMVFAKASQVLVCDSRSAADVQNYGVASGVEFLIEDGPVDPANEQRPDPIEHHRVTQDPLVQRKQHICA